MESKTANMKLSQYKKNLSGFRSNHNIYSKADIFRSWLMLAFSCGPREMHHFPLLLQLKTATHYITPHHGCRRKPNQQRQAFPA